MPQPALHIHLVDDRTKPPVLDGNRSIVVHEVCSRAHRSIHLVPAHQAALESGVAALRAQLRDIIAAFPELARHDDWNVLDVLVFQSAYDDPDVLRCRGVMGFYNDGIPDPFTISPFVELYVLAGNEARLQAAAVHEVGHYLRARAVWEIGEKPFIHRAFEEGLCEHLVAHELGESEVLHNAPLSMDELSVLQKQLVASLDAIQQSQEHAAFTLEGYRLGYHVVQDLLASGHDLNSLFRLPLPATEQTMLSDTSSLLERLTLSS